MTQFFGKYHGTVVNNIDPLMQGRVQVSVAALGGGRLTWAWPCVPYAGDGVGLFAVPPVGANAWVEFEGGDPGARAILAGCFWGVGEAPGTGLPTTKVFKTDGVSVTCEDLPGVGGLTIEVGPPAAPVPMTIACSSSGIELSIGASKVVIGAASVSVNNGALEVI